LRRSSTARTASLAIGLLAIASTSSTALANPTCTPATPSLGDTVSCEYAGGGATTITIPPGTVGVDVTLRGGGGAAGGTDANRGYPGGSGAEVQARLLARTLGSLTVVVGSGGTSQGLGAAGGNGGGFSAIYTGASTSPGDWAAVAGGGGGGGYGTRQCAPARGGEGGGDASGAGRGGDGGDAPGAGGGGVGGGNPGAGGIVTSPLTGTAGVSGVTWGAGGGGGPSGVIRGGGGGAGYGGGGSGGVVNSTSAISGCPTATNDGSGGGAGGSYVKPALQLGLPTYSNSGGAAGGAGGEYWSDPSWYVAGQDGSVVLTFIQTYTVTYDANGATGGPPPTDHWGPYMGGDIVTVCDNHRTDLSCDFPNDDRMTRAGFSFDGWNTAANGSGTAYAPTQTFAISGNTVLYAQWRAPAAPASPGGTGPAAPPAAASSAPVTRMTTPPALRSAAIRCTGAACTTTGALPAGATRVSQTATSGARATARGVARETAATARGTCRVKTTGRGKAATRTYACSIRLAKGSWTITTSALSRTGAVVAQSQKAARVK